MQCRYVGTKTLQKELFYLSWQTFTVLDLDMTTRVDIAVTHKEL